MRRDKHSRRTPEHGNRDIPAVRFWDSIDRDNFESALSGNDIRGERLKQRSQKSEKASHLAPPYSDQRSFQRIRGHSSLSSGSAWDGGRPPRDPLSLRSRDNSHQHRGRSG